MNALSLNGTWDFLVDLDPRYHRLHEGASPPYADPGANRRHWRKVPVPGVWNKYADQLDIFEGVCWFAREFELGDLPRGATARLRFGAVNYKCRVFLNGRYVGAHEGGYTEFVLDVSSALRRGENLLAVEVDNRADGMLLPQCLGYFNYGGIHRDVALEIHRSAFIENAFFEAEPLDGRGRLRVTGTVVRPEKELLAALSCNGAEKTVEVGDEGFLDVEMDVPGVAPWSPDSPALYRAELRLLRCGRLVHEVSADVGFRRLEVAGKEIRLNGRAVFLKGLCYLYDSPAHGLVLEPEAFREDLALIKEMGVNTIRSHFPFTREFYEACDRAGLMIWIESPIYCIHPADEQRGTLFSDPAFRELAASMVTEMIVGARNHPSVAVYGLGNECNVENPEAEEFFRGLAETARRLDDTRPLSYASLYCNVGPMADIVDVLGINEYWGWYDRICPDNAACAGKGAPTEPIDLTILDEKLLSLSRLHDRPILMTEFGADSIGGFHSDRLELWSEEYHAELVRRTFAVLARHPEVLGTFPFCFCDYRDPSKLYNGYWDGMNYKGLVSYHRRPKKAFYALKEIYADM